MRCGDLCAIAIISVIATLIEKSFAIRCWTCNSQTATESFCDDPFDSSIVYRQNRVWSYTDCILPPVSAYNPGYGGGSAAYGGNGAYNSYTSYNGPNRLRPVCQKSKDRIDGRVFVHRKCAWVNEYEPYDKCLSDRTPSYIQREFCEYCESDGCNSGVQYRPIAALVIIAAFMLTFLLL